MWHETNLSRVLLGVSEALLTFDYGLKTINEAHKETQTLQAILIKLLAGKELVSYCPEQHGDPPPELETFDRVCEHTVYNSYMLGLRIGYNIIEISSCKKIIALSLGGHFSGQSPIAEYIKIIGDE